jgi:hypothetical protein
MNTITFFLGAGFSAAAGYPIGNILNVELRKFTEESSAISRYLLKNFENFKEFDYEEFYDFFRSFGCYGNSLPASEEKKLAFQKFIGEEKDCTTVISSFEDEYQKKAFEIIHLCEGKEVQEKYVDFIRFIKQLIGEKNKINFFSLNHDCLLENLFNCHKIQYSDGFDNLDTNFEYTVSKNPNRPMSKFTNLFDKDIRLLKLHGSIDLYSIKPPVNEPLIFLKPRCKERVNFLTSVLNVKRDSSIVTIPLPQFLTGNNSKEWYSENIPYYLYTFKRLSTEFSHSDYLIIIGYSFGDEYINENYLQKIFDTKIPISIIDEKFDSDFLKERKNFRKMPKYLEKVTFNEYLSFLKPFNNQ